MFEMSFQRCLGKLAIGLVASMSGWVSSCTMSAVVHRELAANIVPRGASILALPTVTGMVTFPMDAKATITVTVDKSNSQDVKSYLPRFSYGITKDSDPTKLLDFSKRMDLNPAQSFVAATNPQSFPYDNLPVDGTYKHLLVQAEIVTFKQANGTMFNEEWAWYEVWDIQDRTVPPKPLFSFQYKRAP